MNKTVSLDAMIELLKTMAEVSRLRILALLCQEDLTISDLTFILAQPQSHVLRHLHLLRKAWLVTCYQKGGENYFKFCYNCLSKDIVMAVISALPKHDVMLVRDLERLVEVRKQRQRVGKEHFLRKKAEWKALRLSYIADQVVESALLEIIGDEPFETMLTLGMETDAVSKLFSDLYRHSVEVELESNVLHLSVGEKIFDVVFLHWVLHFLDNPEMALHEVARVLRPHGRLLIVDFVGQKVASSHVCHAHIYRGFSDAQIEQWLENAGLILEQTLCLAPMQNENNKGFMPTIWLARDPRLLIDDIKDKKVDFA
ncbi:MULTISPECIES: methyltransferase domain-containing protein [unclassified Bartonella]|uniref:ArsR/SmtB family transcription factor n=1 Tax=unclassified Bartonella TaxID=2645622 RepID=UPI00236293D1|nr:MULTISPECIES: methyltransferase domain-containing protein [unclassified Bartonella]